MALSLLLQKTLHQQAVMEAMGSYLTNKYAEGYPGKRYYGGCEVVDEVEEIARDRAKRTYLELNMLMYNHIQVHKLIWLYILQY